MTYFETPNDKAAYVAGMTTAAYEAQEDALVAFRETYGEADLDPEDRRYVSDLDVDPVSATDRADLTLVLDHEQHSLTL